MLYRHAAQDIKQHAQLEFTLEHIIIIISYSIPRVLHLYPSCIILFAHAEMRAGARSGMRNTVIPLHLVIILQFCSPTLCSTKAPPQDPPVSMCTCIDIIDYVICLRISVHGENMATTVESDTLEAFLPRLVTAICGDVQRIADQCLSTGLISGSGHRKILESRGSSEDQARALILSIQNSTKTDNRCFEIFLDCLDRELPLLVKEKLSSDIRKDLEDRRAQQDGVICKAIESPSSQSQVTRFMQQGDPQECERQQRSLFGRYERSVKSYAFAFSERAQCKESLQCKTEEREKLRGELTSLGGQNSETKEIETTKERLSACEAEMAELRERIEKLEGVIEEEDMQARRGKNIIMVGTKMFVRMTEHAFKEKEEEYKRLLEDELEKRMQEEKAREQQVAQAQGQVELDEWEIGKSTSCSFISNQLHNGTIIMFTREPNTRFELVHRVSP